MSQAAVLQGAAAKRGTGELAGKVAIVTGAGRMRSIGRRIATTLAQAGAAVVVTGSGRPRHLPG